MSYVNVVPDALAAAAAEVSAIGSSLNAAHAAAALPTTAMAAAALDEVSAAVTSAFSSSARSFKRPAPRRRRLRTSSRRP